MHYDELEINDYPQVARQRASNRDPLVAIEEMTGAKLQALRVAFNSRNGLKEVRGQHFASTTRMPDGAFATRSFRYFSLAGAKKLYMEIIGGADSCFTAQLAPHARPYLDGSGEGQERSLQDDGGLGHPHAEYPRDDARSPRSSRQEGTRSVQQSQKTDMSCMEI